MDLDGNIYIWGGASVGSINDYNHSSFLSGKPVLCAGMIHLQQGRIVGVNNASGHYKPTRRELAKCVQTLLQTYRQSPIALWAYDKSNEHEEPMMAAMFQRKYGIG